MLGGNCGSRMKWSEKRGRLQSIKCKISHPWSLSLFFLPIFAYTSCAFAPSSRLPRVPLLPLSHSLPALSYSPAAQPPFSALAHINCNLQRLSQVLVHSGKKDGWMICCFCVILCTDALPECAHVCAHARTHTHLREIWCKQNEPSRCSAVLMFRPKKAVHRITLEYTLSVSHSLARVQMAHTGIKYKGSFPQNKSISWKQHEIVYCCQI